MKKIKCRRYNLNKYSTIFYLNAFKRFLIRKDRLYVRVIFSLNNRDIAKTTHWSDEGTYLNIDINTKLSCFMKKDYMPYIL